MSVTLRSPTPADIQPCGRIIYEAFHDIATRHGFPPDFESVDQGTLLSGMVIGSPGIFGVIAEQDGRVVGSNFLFEADPIRGIGPITVEPGNQGSGIGRRLMEAVIQRGRPAVSMRLVQDAFNSRSLSLYTSLGFDVKEPLALMQGRPKTSGVRDEYDARPMKAEDVDICIELCGQVYGFERGSELRKPVPISQPWVALRDGKITAYATAPHFWAFGHGVAETEEDMRNLLLGFAAQRPEPLWFLLPTRQSEFFRWCLREGLQVIKPMTLMAMGGYQEPRGCWFPSVLY